MATPATTTAGTPRSQANHPPAAFLTAPDVWLGVQIQVVARSARGAAKG
ncbi:hypothetical protein AB0F91_37465 [Amycolatopsis sp. NPDC023774]